MPKQTDRPEQRHSHATHRSTGIRQAYACATETHGICRQRGASAAAMAAWQKRPPSLPRHRPRPALGRLATICTMAPCIVTATVSGEAGAPPGSSSSGDATSKDIVATGGVQEKDEEEQAPDSEGLASTIDTRCRGSACESSSQHEVPTAMAPATPSNLQTPGDEEEEDEEEMIRRLAWIRYYVKNNDTDKALELGWDGDMAFMRESDASMSSHPAASGSALTVDPQKTMCRI